MNRIRLLLCLVFAVTVVSVAAGQAVQTPGVTSGVTRTRAADLLAHGVASMPFEETFESGALQPYWTVSGTGPYCSQVTSADAPQNGAYHLTMQSSLDSSYARNEVSLCIDLAGYVNVMLIYACKSFSDEPHGPPPSLFTDGADFDGVAISQDGVTWHEVHDLRNLSTVYTQTAVDLDSELAELGWSYNETFRIRFSQYDNYAIPMDGIAIDSIYILGQYAVPAITVTVPAAAAEGDGVLTAQGTVRLARSPTNDVSVTLASSDTSEVTVSQSLTIPAGQSTAIFDITIADDADLDGTQIATVTCSVPGYANGTGSVHVHDNETALLGVILPDAAAEGVGSVQGQVTVSAPAGASVTVSLDSSDTSELTVPVSVVVPAGQTNAVFDASVLDDTLIDGQQTVWVTARVQNWADGSNTITVLDNESTNLTLALPVSGYEGQVFTNGGQVVIGGTLTTNLTVTLSSADASELQVPETVTLLAGQTSVTFSVTLATDGVTDGVQTGTVTASGAGFAAAAGSVEVRDRDVHHFGFGAIATPQAAGTPFSVTFSAQDINGATITVHQGAVSLAGAGDHGLIMMKPTNVTMTNGVWSGGVRVRTPDTNVRLTAAGGQGDSAPSNPFDVLVGPVDHFAWDAIASPQRVDVPFPVTLVAQDAANNLVTGFTNSVSLSGRRVEGATSNVQVLAFIRYADTVAGGEFLGTLTAISNSLCVALMPTNTGNFVSGVWSGSMAVSEAASNMCLLADDGSGHSGTSGVFTADAFADLGITLTDSPDPVAAGSNLTYSVCVSNTGPDKATGVRVSLPLTAATGFVSASASQGTCARVIDTVIWSVGVVSNGAAVTAAITVAPALAGVLTNTATVTANGSEPVANNAASALTTVTGSGRLAVTPDSNLCATVFKGGLFSPVSQVYTLTNSGSARLSWYATHTASWVTLLPDGGTLEAYAATEVTAAINAGVKSLAVGAYNDSLLFATVTNGAGSATRAVALTVQPLPAITTNTLANPAFITIPSSGAASPYPSTIYVLELSGTVTRVTATLVNVKHIYPDDVDVLLVGPAGQTVMLMSDAGGGTSLSNVTLGFADAAAAALPDATPISAGTFRPTDFDAGETLPAPAPIGPYGSSLSVFNGQNPNGAWSLYVFDDTAGFGGSISNGWQLTLTTENEVEQFADLGVGVTGSPDPVTVGSNLVYSVCVSNSGPDKAAGVLVSNTLPATVSYVSASASQGTCSHVNGTVSWVVGVLSNGVEATASITVVPTLGGTLTNWVTLSAEATDTNLANNVAGTLTAVTGCGVLGVTPDSGLSASGFEGGPFSPASQVYVLTNSGTDTLMWQADSLTGWVSLSATGGTLPARAAATVTVSLNADADSLHAGHHDATVAFTNLTTAAGGATRDVKLTVLGGGVLGTLFAGDNGYAGNMFDVVPKRNLGITALDVNVSPAGQRAEVTVYCRQGSSFGHEGSSAGWTLLGARTVIAAGQSLPTFVDLSGNGVAFLRGQTYGLYVCVDYGSGATMHYTQGSGSYENGVIRLISNCGKGDPPFTGGTYASRIWNGSLYYDTELVDDLGISPSEGLVFQGTEGGPFNPPGGAFTVADRGDAGLAWSAGCASNWVTLVPGSGTLLAGASNSVAVTVNAAASTLAEGAYTATVAFSNAAGGAVQLRAVVLKVWSTKLTVTLPSSGYEGQVFPGGGRVAIGYTLASNLTVSLSSGDTNRLQVPPQVMIVAGQTNAAFDLSLPGNSKAEGPLAATVTAAAVGFAPGEAMITVADDDIASNAVIIAAFDLATDPGWSCEGQWQFGRPAGRGGAMFGNPDPLGGFTGTNAFGVNLQGDYSTQPGGPYRLTAGPFNFAGYSHVTLQFRCWLNTDLDPYARVAVEVSTNGTDWGPVWSNGQLGFYGNAWSLVEYPLPAADHATRVFVRWSYQIGAEAFAASGWNLDDIVFFGESVKVPQTSRGTPLTWLQAYGLTNFSGEVEDMLDVDGDGHVTWQEHVTGSIPTNRDSVFRSRIAVSNNVPWVTWTPDLGTARVYTVEGVTNLADGVWCPANAGSRFFRVKVQMPQ